MKQLRVLLIEDHFLTRIALQAIFARRPSIQIVGEAADGDTGLAMYKQHQPDVVVLDLNLPGINGFDLIPKLREGPSRARILVLSNYHGSEDIYRTMRSGAMGYLSKNVSAEELLNAIESVGKGLRYLPNAALQQLAERMPAVELTPRETDVLEGIAQGMSNLEIANELRIAEKTVRIRVSSVLDKLGARNRTEATIHALRRGLIHFF